MIYFIGIVVVAVGEFQSPQLVVAATYLRYQQGET